MPLEMHSPSSQTLAASAALLVSLLGAFAYLAVLWTRALKRFDAIELPSLDKAYAAQGKQFEGFEKIFGSALISTEKRVNILKQDGIPKMFASRMLWVPMISTCDPKHLPLISKMRKSQVYDFLREYIGYDSVLFMEGEQGRNHRAIMNRGFGNGDFKRMHAESMIDAALRLRRRVVDVCSDLTSQTGVDGVLNHATLEIIARSGFGYMVEHNSQAAEDLTKLIALGPIPLPFCQAAGRSLGLKTALSRVASTPLLRLLWISALPKRH